MTTPTATDIEERQIAGAVSLRRDITNAFAWAVLTTACEGGIVYWCDDENTRKRRSERAPNADWKRLTFECNATGSWVKHDIQPESIAAAMSRIVSGEAQVRADIRSSILEAIVQDDAGQIDADAADVIVQIAAFGEVVYG